ncbi:MAG: hypothetical protein FD143_1459 [Ignavibacteria bacterium]|nr:MAG: hypothetical protein FD143_1459 [Ignavibacteria bacterium]KAF0160510.1 MAG: hypothetical protein FD188_1684 [Ignavibacteria bacterium]
MNKRLFIKIFLAVLFTSSFNLYSQAENVPIDNDVYFFLKEMKVKGIIGGIHDDNPNMSRYEVKNLISKIEEYKTSLSKTEMGLLQKFKAEFFDEEADSNNTAQFFGDGLSSSFSDLFSKKNRYMYVYRDPEASFYFNVLGRFAFGHTFEPEQYNSTLYDIGFRFRGTVFNSLGYSLSVQKGGVSGSQSYAKLFDPRLNYNFKFIEAIENIGNYDFAEGYLRYYAEPAKDMRLSLQLGREKIKFGYGYGSKFVISGDHTYLDFFRLNFDYGVFSFTSLTASTVGTFNENRDLNYTKYLALNRFKLYFPKLFEFGLGENIIYSGRGLDLAYINPMIFYKFVEMSLQDRDNGTLWLDFQTYFLKNVEISGTFFLDENILSQLQDLNLFSNKTAYQIGAFWYSPFSLNDLSLTAEYTKIRPYVYTHTNEKNSYTAYGELLGHSIGPNSDEILFKADYNLSEWIRLSGSYQYVRSGENIYDNEERLLFNAGGDKFVPHRMNIDSKRIDFLDGERINKNILTANIKMEPLRKFYINLTGKLLIVNNITRNLEDITSYVLFTANFEL